MTEWFYIKAGVRSGPVEQPLLQQMLDRHELAATDLVWHQGMTEWLPAASVAELHIPIAAPALDYASHRLPERAAVALRGYGVPTGDTSVWPLNEADLAHFSSASKYRRIVRQGAALYRGIAMVSALAVPFLVVMLIVPLGILDIGAGEVLSALVITLATAIVCGAGAWATVRNQLWGPYSVAGVLVITLLVQIAASVPSFAASADRAVVAITGDIISALFTALFLVTTFRASTAITRLRATPAWCQEALAIGKW